MGRKVKLDLLMLKIFSSNKKSIGIDISDHTIEVVELSMSAKGINIENISSIILSSGIVERGRIKDKIKLAELVKKMLKDASPNPIITKQIIFGLPESQVYTHIATLMPHDKQARDELVIKEAENNIPLQNNELEFSYRSLYESESGVEIVLVAASREVIFEWQEFFKSLDIFIEVFDIEALALFRGISTSQLKYPMSIVDIGAVTTNVSIFDKNGLRYSYAINIAGKQFTQEIAKVLNKSEEEAEELKKEIGLSKPGEQVNEILTKALQLVVLDIKKTFNYFNTQKNENIVEVVLVGGSSALKGLVDYFNINLGVPTKIGNQVLDEHASGEKLNYIEAIGLALRGLDKKWDKSDPAILPIKEERKPNKTRNLVSNILSGFMSFFKQSKDNTPKGGGDDDQDSDRKLHIQKIILIGLFIVAMVAIPASYWYRGVQKEKKEADIKSRLEAIDIATEKQKLEDIKKDDIINPNVLPQAEKSVIIIKSVNVRSGPGINYAKIAEVLPKETYPLLEEKGNWYRIKLNDKIDGWVVSRYAIKK
ncbi:MAG: pilus assembly protein PilM [Patescibacteria group bacterium]